MANFNSGGRQLVDAAFSSGMEVRVTSGQINVSSGLLGILSGQISVVSGNINAFLLSGANWIGAIGGYFGGGSYPTPVSGGVSPARMDSAGGVRVNPETGKKTYSYFQQTTLSSGQTFDLFFLTYTGSGSSQKPIKLTRCAFSILAASGIVGVPPIGVLLTRRTTLTNSGLSRSFAATSQGIPHDPNDPPGTGMFGFYSSYSGQVLGTLDTGFIRTKTLGVAPTSGGMVADGVEWKFPDGGGRCPTLRNSGSQFTLELNFPFGGSLNINPAAWAGGMEWIEDEE